MTGILKDLMHHRADGLEEFRPDLDAIVAAGDRRVRRRRVVVGSAGAAALLTAAIAVPVGLQLRDGGGDGRADVTAGETRSLTWADGSTIHVGDETIDVGHEIHAFVATTEGYLIADPAGSVWSWVDGEATKVGELSTDAEVTDPLLVADGARAGWVEADRDRPYFMVLDQSESGGGILEVPAQNLDGPGPQLWAIDDDVAYARDGSEQVRIDLVNGSRTPLAQDAPRLEVHDVENGLMLVTRPDGDDEEITTLTRDLSLPGTQVGVRRGDLSPSGRHVMSENSAENSDDFTLIELATGEPRNPDAKGDYGFFLGYAWTDDDTYSAFGITGIGEADSSEESMVIDLLTCHVSTATCEVSDEHPRWDDFQLPVGQHIDN
jgi:hypothetical protein